MTDNILKKTLSGNSENFLSQIFDREKRSQPEWFALKTLFLSVLTGRSTLVKDIAEPLSKGMCPLARKNAQERVSAWLKNYDFDAEAEAWMLKNIPAAGRDNLTFAVDFSDISKEFGGKGMEGMAMGWDGSRGVTAMGHDFICVSLVGPDYPEALPVYVKVMKGRKSHEELLRGAIDAVMKATGGHGWIAEDRGMDGAEHICEMGRAGRRAVIRVKDMGRDVFGDGRRIDESLGMRNFQEVHLHVHSGDRKVQLRYSPGVIQYCKDKNKKDAETENTDVLVVESRFDGRSIWLYAVCPKEEWSDPRTMLACAIRAAQAYCDRWQIETSFLFMKQEFAMEKLRVRTFARLEKVFRLCVLSYIYVTRFMRSSSGFKKIVKHIADNVGILSMRTHALLAGIRALVGEAHLRHITGRPRKKRKFDPLQMTLGI